MTVFYCSFVYRDQPSIPIYIYTEIAPYCRVRDSCVPRTYRRMYVERYATNAAKSVIRKSYYVDVLTVNISRAHSNTGQKATPSGEIVFYKRIYGRGFRGHTRVNPGGLDRAYFGTNLTTCNLQPPRASDQSARGLITRIYILAYVTNQCPRTNHIGHKRT